jgi:hypothetical protein
MTKPESGSASPSTFIQELYQRIIGIMSLDCHIRFRSVSLYGYSAREDQLRKYSVQKKVYVFTKALPSGGQCYDALGDLE